MQKTSFLFLLVVLGVSLLAAYQAFTDVPSSQGTIRFLALSAFFLLCVTLAIGPLAVLAPQQFAPLIEPRRSIGLAAFIFALLHAILVVALYFSWDFATAFSFQSNLIAIPAFAILVALALTSCDFAVQKMGMVKWKLLQYFAYPAFVLIAIHFALKANGLVAKQGLAQNLNLAEVSLAILAVITVILQLAGFYLRKKRAQSQAASVSERKQE